MAYTVNSAFKHFHDNIKLNKSDSEIALSSRDNLFYNINKFPSNEEDFPKLYLSKHNKFGSFARKTKINPLDDIDLLVCISAEGSLYHEYSPDDVRIIASTKSESLKKLSDEDILNSKKVIEKFKSSLKDIHHYKNAEINRRQEAVTLSLDSYKWTFDIVPCFFTAPTENNETYYLIPNGKGNWKFTDPRIDQERITAINQQNNGKILKIIRIFKHLAREYNLFKNASYILEVLILDYYENNPIQDQISAEIIKVLLHIKYHVQYLIKDPQHIRNNINSLDNDEIVKIRKRLDECYWLMLDAIDHEVNDDPEEAINIWREIMGDKFPKYGWVMNMSNLSIYQNSEENLSRRVACKELYSHAKKWVYVEVAIGTIVGVLYITYTFSNPIFSFLQLDIHKNWLFPLITPIISFVFTLIDTYVINSKIKTNIEKAAYVQDIFDRNVLELPVNKMIVPSFESVIFVMDKDKLSEFKDWYDVKISTIPIEFGRVIAQKSNCIWDNHLKNDFSNTLGIILLILFILLIIAQCHTYDLKSFILGIMSLLYNVNLFIKYRKAHISSKNEGIKLNNNINELWSSTIKSKDINNLIEASKDIQTQIFYHRTNTALVPDIFYKLRRNEHQNITGTYIDNMINEYNANFVFTNSINENEYNEY